MLSTTRAAQRGQVLVLFAGGAIALLIVAALAFDVGMMLVERRDEQNGADAAALAGARYVLESADYHGNCVGAPGGNEAVQAACDLAVTNGFNDADGDDEVIVDIPPIHGRYVGFPGFVEVRINGTRPSVFGGIIGQALWPVGVFAVAANQPNLTFPFSMLALNETKCKAMQFSGGGTVTANGNIHANSTGSECPGDPYSISRTGGAEVTVTTAPDGSCQSVGLIQDPGDKMVCTKAENSFVLPDPLRFLPAPDQPPLAPAMDEVGSDPDSIDQPWYCPGSDAKPPVIAQTNTCDVGGNGAAYTGKAWILYPGLYPAGLAVTNNATAYLMPGIYWIGGGGFNVKNGGSVITIASVGDATVLPAAATWGGGVMIYNSKLPTVAGGPISMEGSLANLKLEDFQVPESDPDSIYNGIVIFQDRTVTETVTLNGAASTSDINGIIYVPEGLVKLNGNGGTLEVDQIIADSYLIDGTGDIYVTKDTGVDSVISGAGLVD